MNAAPALVQRVLVKFAALSSLLAIGCQGDVPGKSQSGSPRVAAAAEVVSAGEVIIAPPAAPYRVVAVASPGTLTGSISVSGSIDPRPPAETGKESAICGPAIADESGQMLGGGLVGVVVWLDGVRSGKPIGVERRLELESKRCRLVPRVQGAATGSAVNILAHDDFRERLTFVAAGEAAPRATILLGGGEQVIPTELPFKAPGLVTVQDTDHPWPRAYLAVFDHPYYAVTGPGGTFSIDGIPPGKYTLRVWHERATAATQAVEIGAGGAAKVAISMTAR